ncbi:MAG: tripartite tricarboxylate transporter substrate binding protein [Betaproteobacteria bacterium]|nr:MAG: tripartite tricarboxylate transporter substrate binding protein [Betaproteobacteria bacterium]
MKPPAFERAVARAVAALACSLTYTLASHAQGFPAKPILLILPTAPGGPVDIVARIVAPEASKLLGQPVVMENRPGASQKIGIHGMLRAPRDGYTLAAISPASATINPLVDRNVGYDPLKDFTLLSQTVGHPAVVTVHPSLPVRTLQELVAYAKANPGKLAYGSGGNGTSLQFSTSELLMKLGITAVHVPYKSDGPALNDLLGGQINLMIPRAVGAARDQQHEPLAAPAQRAYLRGDRDSGAEGLQLPDLDRLCRGRGDSGGSREKAPGRVHARPARARRAPIARGERFRSHRFDRAAVRAGTARGARSQPQGHRERRDHDRMRSARLLSR